MRKSIGFVAVLLAFVGIPWLIGALTPDGHVGVCASATKQVRLPDQDCQPVRESGDNWVYFDSGGGVPAVGQSTSGGSQTAPGSGSVQLGGVPAQGQAGDDEDDNNGNNGVNSDDDDDDDDAGSSGGDDD